MPRPSSKLTSSCSSLQNIRDYKYAIFVVIVCIYGNSTMSILCGLSWGCRHLRHLITGRFFTVRPFIVSPPANWILFDRVLSLHPAVVHPGLTHLLGNCSLRCTQLSTCQDTIPGTCKGEKQRFTLAHTCREFSPQPPGSKAGQDDRGASQRRLAHSMAGREQQAIERTPHMVTYLFLSGFTAQRYTQL